MIRLRNNLHRIRVFLRDPHKKPRLQIFEEVIRLWVASKYFPLYYFGRFLYRKGMGSVENYLDMRAYRKIIYSPELTHPEFETFLQDKALFSDFCSVKRIPHPAVVARSEGRWFSRQGETKRLDSPEAFSGFLENCLRQSGSDRLFVKQRKGFGGSGVQVIRAGDLQRDILKHFKRILGGSYVFQLPIVQHPEISRIYDAAVNTLRIETYLDRIGRLHLLGQYMRFGSGGAFIDNISSGGWFVTVDPFSGKMTGNGWQGMVHGGGNSAFHPDTGVRFEGCAIPYYRETLELCRKLCGMIPNRLTGWDFALTESGPVVVEGNITPGIVAGEIAFGGYRDHPVYLENIGYELKGELHVSAR